MPAKSHLEERIEERIEEKLHPHSAFMIGFVRVMGNPGVLVFWIILAANFISREWVEPNGRGKLACIAGVAERKRDVLALLGEGLEDRAAHEAGDGAAELEPWRARALGGQRAHLRRALAQRRAREHHHGEAIVEV